MSKIKEKLRINKSQTQIKSLFNNIKNGRAKVFVWMIVGSEKVTAEAILKIVREKRNEIIVTPTHKSEADFARIVGNKDKVNFYIPNEKILFQSIVKNIDDDLRMTLQMPSLITQVERRSHLRLFVDEEVETKINFYKTVGHQGSRTQGFSKKCYDFSAGGLAIVLTRSESKYFEKGELIFGAELVIDDKIMIVDLEVSNTVKINPNAENQLMYSGMKLGLSFKEIKKSDQDFIERFVFNLIDLDEIIGF